MVEVFLFAQEQLGLHGFAHIVIAFPFIHLGRQDFAFVLVEPGGELPAFFLGEREHLLFDFSETHTGALYFRQAPFVNQNADAACYSESPPALSN